MANLGRIEESPHDPLIPIRAMQLLVLHSSICPSEDVSMTERLIVACPACNTLNRAPRDKLATGSGGKCGECGAPLFEGHPVALNARSFDAHAVKSDIPLLVDFWAPWCGPCRAMAPQFEKAASHLEPTVRFAKVNTDEEQQLAGRFGIQGIPTMILFRHGKEIARQSGVMNAAGIGSWVQQALR
jgi:thioredoxin 2